MPSELTPAEQFFFNKLTTDSQMATLAPGGFHSERVHQVPAGVYVIWTNVGGPLDVSEVQGVRIYSEALYLIRAIAKTGDFNILQPAASRLDTLLHRQNGSVMGGDGTAYTILWCARERPYSQVEQVVDIERRHLGGYYRVYVQP